MTGCVNLSLNLTNGLNRVCVDGHRRPAVRAFRSSISPSRFPTRRFNTALCIVSPHPPVDSPVEPELLDVGIRSSRMCETRRPMLMSKVCCRRNIMLTEMPEHTRRVRKKGYFRTNYVIGSAKYLVTASMIAADASWCREGCPGRACFLHMVTFQAPESTPAIQLWNGDGGS